MADTDYRLPPLYFAAWAIVALGILGLGTVLLLHPSEQIHTGLLYIFSACIAFGTGEILNHPKPARLTIDKRTPPSELQPSRRRNPCSLGNLFDIGALLLFFIGLSTLLSLR